MPKAPPQNNALRRNQACRTCRKRKLKCDAARPHCGTCVKAWKNKIAVPAPLGYTHEDSPDCHYDPVEGINPLPVPEAYDPSEKIRILQAQLAEMRGQLNKAHREHSRSNSPNHIFSTNSPSNVSPHNSPQFSAMLGSPSQRHGAPMNGSTQPQQNHAGQGLHHPAAQNLPVEGIESMHAMDSQGPPSLYGPTQPNRYSQLLMSGWSIDLPDPAVVMHLIDVFFSCDACGSRVIHRPSFLASLSLSASNPDHPHPALLHAICATASRWVSRDVSNDSDGQRRDKFAEFHARKARSYIDQTMTSGTSIFSVLQACILLSWYFYMEGRWVEVWIFSGFQTRVAVPLRLNYPGTHTADGPASGSYLPPPTSVRDLECRRRAWWMAIMFDRIVSIGGWLHGIDAQDIGTELPLRAVDFDMEVDTASNPQHLWTDGLLTNHPHGYTDSFILLIKATMLFGRVTDFNVRSGLKSSITGRQTRADDDARYAMFQELDNLVSREFLEMLPSDYKSCLGVGEQPDGSCIDTDLYLVHLIPHAAAITLHNAHIDFTDPNNASAERCLTAARSILACYYLITSTSFDITRLHPTAVICWYLAAVVQVRYCKRLIQIGDREQEANAWGEINLLRLAMLEYGALSPIGVRQEKLLQGILTEILHLTSTHDPLSVRMPLYPFSHTRIFQNATRDTHAEDGTAGSHVAPLPSPPPFDEHEPLALSSSP